MKKIFIICVVLFALGALPGVAYAADNFAASGTEKAQPKAIPCVPSLPCISKTTQLSGQATRTYITETVGTNLMVTLMGIAAIASVVMIIVGGVQMHLAMGVDDAIGKAKKTITWAIGGLILSTLAGAIVTLVSRISIE